MDEIEGYSKPVLVTTKSNPNGTAEVFTTENVAYADSVVCAIDL